MRGGHYVPAAVAFDDVLGQQPEIEIPDRESSTEDAPDVIDMSGAALRMIQARRFRRPLPQRLIGIEDVTEYTFEPPGMSVIGADEDIPDGVYPIYDQIRERFRAAVGKPKAVRFDDEESYEDWRASRRQDHLAELSDRLAKLEEAFNEHLSDPDAHQAQVVGAVVDAVRGGKAVDIGLPPSQRGKIECWLDGDEVLVSARTPDGIVTSGAPVADTFQEVVGCAKAVGCCGAEVLMVGAQLAPAVVGRQVLGDLCRAAPVLAKEVPGFVGALIPETDPGLAAGMALLQRCQAGDKQACREAIKMASGNGARLLRRAGDHLKRGQGDKDRKTRVERKRSLIGGLVDAVRGWLS